MKEVTQVVAQAGKYLTFRLSNEDYGLEILKVHEIIGLMSVTHIPRMQDSIRGVINLRGRLIPVIDMRIKMGMPTAEATEKSCIIVVDIDQTSTGILVDSVSEVLNIQAAQIEPAPSIGTAEDSRFLLGMGKVGQKVVLLLDICRILAVGQSQEQLQQAA